MYVSPQYLLYYARWKSWLYPICKVIRQPVIPSWMLDSDKRFRDQRQRTLSHTARHRRVCTSSHCPKSLDEAQAAQMGSAEAPWAGGRSPVIASSKHTGCFYPGRRHCRTPKSAHSKLSAEKWSRLCLLGQLAGRVGHSHAGLPPNTTQGYFAIKITHTLNFWPRNTTSRNLSYTFTCTGTKWWP